MAATYLLTIGGDPQTMQPGWSHEATANGRDTLTCEVLSLDASYRPALDAAVVLSEVVGVATSSVANPTVITADEPHGIVSGQTITLAEHTGSTPALNGEHVATRIGATTFSVPVNVTVGGSGGTVARRIFGGTILTPSEAGLGGLGVTPIRTRIEAVDYNAQAEHRYVNEVLAAGTLKSMLTTLAANYDFTLHPAQVDGPPLSALPCDYALLQSVLDLLSVLTGYVWEFDEWNRLRMYLPGTDAAPINIVQGETQAIGDIVVEPTRSQYANRIILRFSEAARAAYGFLGGSDNVANNDTVKLGGQTYTFKTVLTNVAGYVLRGASLGESLNNLAAAITLGAGSGTVYAAATIINASASAYVHAYGMLVAVALTPGAAGNSIACETTAANISWYGEGAIPMAALHLGADRSLTNVAIAEHPGEQAAHGIREVVIQSPETTNAAAADILAAAVLAVRLPVPRTAKYTTYALGLRPGQTQTVTIAKRNLGNTFLLTEVSTRNEVGNLVLRSVTAIESVLLQAATRWREYYKQIAGAVSGSAQTVAAGGGGGGGTAGGGAVVYFFGSGVQQTTAGGWIAANTIQVRIDTAVRGSLVGTCYVRLSARAGSVSARLRNVVDGATCGTSAAITDTALQWASFGVMLTAGAKYYAVELSPSLADTDIELGSGHLE